MPATGPRTDDLGFYLFLQGIPATFFVTGEHAASEPELCLQLTRWGHSVVNHTQTHNGLPWETPAQMIADVVDADFSIGAAANPDSLLLGPPYLSWSEAVASVLNGDPQTRKYTGPIGSNIGGDDWQFWEDPNKTPSDKLTDCVNSYYNGITQARCGIVTMHDSSQNPAAAALNQTFELTRRLIPQLIADGYRFIRLDAAPQVRSAMLVSSIVGLKAANSLYISPQGGGGGSILANGPGLYAWEELGLVQLGNGQHAIRTPNGQFMSTQPTGEILANGNGVSDWEKFDLIGPSPVKIKASNGNYATVPTFGPFAGHIMANATVAQAELFTLEYVT